MHHPSNALTGAVLPTPLPRSLGSVEPELTIQQVVAVYIAGEAVGALTQTAIADKLGRLRFMELMCVVVTIGTVIQTASVNIGMFLAGRALAGFAVG